MPRPIAIYFAATLLGISVFGQDSGSRFDALKQALMLSDSQLEQLQRNLLKPPSANTENGPAVAGAPPGSFFGGGRVDIYTPDARRSIAIRTDARVDEQRQLLNDSQRTKLDLIAKVLDDGQTAALAIRLGLVTEREWGGAICIYPLSWYGPDNTVQRDAVLAPSQIQQFRQVERNSKLLAALAKEYDARLHSTAAASGDAVSPDQVKSDIEKMKAQVNAILDAKQKAMLTEFETNLLLANQAVELGLVSPPVRGEPLCQ